MKNMILFVIDSVHYKYILESKYKNTPMPFLMELKQKGLSCTNMYSQAPFTEAAIMPLLSGQNLLDNGGYMERFKYRKSIMEVFKENGYQTFVNHYYPCIYPTETFKGVDKMLWVNAFDFQQIWGYRFDYFKSLYLNNELSDNEIAMLVELLEDNLTTWLNSSRMLRDKDSIVSIITNNANLDGIEDEVIILEKELQRFQCDRLGYLDELMKLQANHILFTIKTRTLNKKVSDEKRTEITKRYYDTFKRIYQLNKKYNMKNMKLPIGKIVRACLHKELPNAKQYAAMYKNAVLDKDLYERIEGNYPSFKAAICMRSYIDNGIELLKNRDQEKPFFFYFHVDDAHAPENFFSSDISDISILDNEFNNINSYLDHLKKDYHGSLTMDLSLLYVDSCLKHLFDELAGMGELNNTVVAITADHGFSYGYTTLRTNYVNNPHIENYQIPFILYDGSATASEKNGYYQTKDIPPTLLHACGLEIPSYMNGVSVLGNSGRNYAIIEYMGGGCPDMIRRPIVIGVRTENYAVTLSINLLNEFHNYVITHLYDLKNDPLENINLSSKSKQYNIKYELEILENRFHQLKQNFKESKNAFHNSSCSCLQYLSISK